MTMPHVLTDYMHKRECVIARLQLKIGKAVSAAVARPEGVTASEVLIALNGAAQRWSREIHKQDIAENDPANKGVTVGAGGDVP